MSRLRIDFEGETPAHLADALRSLAEQVEAGQLGRGSGHGGRGYKGTVAYDETMPLADVLRDYRDGDEHGWATEFAYLREHHGPKLDLLAASVQEVGMLKPVLLGSDGRVWDGHHRLCVASMLALESVPVERALSMDG